MVMYKRKSVFAAKVESTIGTAETLADADAAYNAYNLMSQGQIDVEQREAQGSMNYLAGVPGARRGVVTFRTDLGWDGTTTLPSWATVLLPACGFVESSQVFTPRSEAPGANVKTLTIGGFVDGQKKLLAGAVGDFQLVLPSGRMAYIDWTFTGVWQPVTDVALPSPAYPTPSPIRFADATMTYDSVAQKVESTTINAGNEVILREDPATPAGFSSGLITNRAPRVTANPEAVLVATQDRFGAWLAATESALAFTLKGPSDSTITISCPKAQIVNVQQGDRGRMVTDEIEWTCNKNGTDNDEEVSITFNEAT